MSTSSRLSSANDILSIVETLSSEDKPPFYTAVVSLLERIIDDLKTPVWQVSHEEIQRPSFLEPVGLSPSGGLSPPAGLSPIASVESEEEFPPPPAPAPSPSVAQQQPQAQPQPQPQAQPEDTRSVGQGTATTNGNRRDFTKFCRSLNLQQGHVFTLMKGPAVEAKFTLQYSQERAMLFIDCSDGTRISANSPSGVVQRYIRKVKGKIVSSNGWDRLNMQWNRTNTFFPISSSIWSNCSWNVKQQSFNHDT